MEVRLTEKSIKDRVLRIWLRRVPKESGILHAYKVEQSQFDKPIGTATLYGRGWGSSAEERTMLYFRLVPGFPELELSVGDVIAIRIEAEDGLHEIELDVLEVE